MLPSELKTSFTWSGFDKKTDMFFLCHLSGLNSGLLHLTISPYLVWIWSKNLRNDKMSNSPPFFALINSLIFKNFLFIWKSYHIVLCSISFLWLDTNLDQANHRKILGFPKYFSIDLIRKIFVIFLLELMVCFLKAFLNLKYALKIRLLALDFLRVLFWISCE